MHMTSCIRLVLILCAVDAIYARRILDATQQRHASRRMKYTENHTIAQMQTQVQDLPGLKEFNQTHHAGLIQVDPLYDANIFYWHFQAKNDHETLPLVIW